MKIKLVWKIGSEVTRLSTNANMTLLQWATAKKVRYKKTLRKTPTDSHLGYFRCKCINVIFCFFLYFSDQFLYHCTIAFFHICHLSSACYKPLEALKITQRTVYKGFMSFTFQQLFRQKMYFHESWIFLTLGLKSDELAIWVVG